MLTVLIFSHNRHRYLRRAIDYWSQLPFEVIIADDSEKPLPFDTPPGFNYLFRPGVSIPDRLYEMAGLVCTDYAVIVADDDFQGYNGILSCIDFLNKHNDYVAAQGHFTRFFFNHRLINIADYTYANNYQFESENPRSRIEQAMENLFMHQVYSVFRTETLRKIVDTIQGVNWRVGGVIELSFSLILLALGKFRTLPVFYSAREGSAPDQFKSNALPIDAWLTGTEYLAEIETWRRKCCNTYIAEVGSTESLARDTFDTAISKYMMRHSKKRLERKNPPIHKSILKRFFQDRLSEIVQTVSIELRMNKDQKTYKIGYPWCDRAASEDWIRMKKIILKHGHLHAAQCS